MKVALFTPLPPVRSGVAHYASMLIPALREHMELEVISDNRQPTTNNRIYQLGNNPHHEWIYRAAMADPGVVVLHDIVLHHLIVEMTLARGDVEGYVAAMRASHGEAGAAWARGRAAGMHHEMANFLMPASIELANRSRAVIVHNRYASDRLRSFGVRTPVYIVPHPFEAHAEAASRRDEIRARHGFSSQHRVIGLFGFLTSAKRSEIVLQAFADARRRFPELRLLVVGEPAPNIDVAAFAAEGVTFAGYVPDEEFPAYFAAVDRLVNLRYPTAGETSGTLIRAFDAGKPVAVSDYAQFAELPGDCVVKIPFDDSEVATLADFFVGDLPDFADAQRRWLDANARIDLTVQGYLNALSVAQAILPARAGEIAYATQSAIPLFPKLELVSVAGNIVTVRNAGDTTLRTRIYGEPAYRMIVNGRWLELPGDLRPGESALLELPRDMHGPVVFRHAIQDIPLLEPEVWARAVVQ